MSELDFIRSCRADDTDGEFHLQELMAFMPVNLQPKRKMSLMVVLLAFPT